MPGLSLPCEQDIGNYKKKFKVAGMRMPTRMIKGLAIAVAIAILLGLWMVLALGLDPTMLSLLFPLIGIVGFVYGFYEHNDFTPEQYLPLHVKAMFMGNATQYRSSVYMFYDIPDIKEVHLDRSYIKERKKRGTQAAEIYLSRLEVSEKGNQAGEESLS